jgi:Spy/CpxP family protein refolding chaperone
MRKIPTIVTLAAVAAIFLTLPAAAQERAPIGMADRIERHAQGLLRCLRGLDLTDSQKTDIKAILDASKPTIQADAAAIRAARQKLNADYDAGADKSVLGQDYIDMRAAVKKLHDDGTAVKGQVLGKLTADQATRAQACLSSSHPHGMGAHGMGARSSD